ASPTTTIYTLSLHDALPISVALNPDHTLEFVDPGGPAGGVVPAALRLVDGGLDELRHADRRHVAIITAAATLDNRLSTIYRYLRSEEHTSELQSPCNLVCRL